MIRLNEEKLARLHTADEVLEKEYGAPGTPSRDAFDKIGKKREYISTIERGNSDMQMSTFLQIASALGLRFSLVVG